MDFLTQENELERISKLVNPLHKVVGSMGKLGSFIRLKTTPNVSHIYIKKGVQNRALLRLAQHIAGQAKESPTTLKLKRDKKGKFKFSVLFTSVVLSRMSVDDIYTKLLNLTKKHKVLVLILQPLHPGGKIHEMVASGVSLL